jgi:hypothetical protein
MPIPKATPGESQQDFMARCMSDLKVEFPQTDQRIAICYDAWRGE